MEIYSYSKETNEYIGATVARLDPLGTLSAGENKYLIPAHSTNISPPTAGSNEVAVFENGSWTVKKDHRGETWFNGYDSPVTIENIGDPVEEWGLTLTQPEAPLATPEQVKTLAGRKILAKYSEHQQRNMLATASSLQDILIEGGTWDTTQQAASTNLKDAWTWIQSVRVASNVIEASPPSIESLDTDPRWPVSPS